MSKFQLSRRAVIRGAGTIAIGLPWLEVMSDSGPARAATQRNMPKRFLAVYHPGGTVLEKWRPTGTEAAFTLSPILAPFESVKSRLVLLDGLPLTWGDLFMFNVEQTQGGMVGWLTGMVPRGAGAFVPDPSIDQVLAPTLSAGKRLASLQMAVRWGTGKSLGKLSPINTCVFGAETPSLPIAPRLDPVAIWEALFGGQARPMAERAWDRSILDAVDKRYASLARRLGVADRQRLEAHLERIRDLEKRVAAQAGACLPPALVDTSDYDPASGLKSNAAGSIKDIPTDSAIPKVGKLMMDMMIMAMACDITAVGLMQWSDSEAKHTFPWLGLPEHHRFYQHDGGYHPVELEAIYTWYSSQHAYLLEQMAKVDLGGHSLLDETIVFFGTELQNPATHEKKDMPFLLAGGGLRGGRWLRYADAPPHNNLLLSLLNLYGDPRTTFGDPRCVTGPLPNLV
jgi:hypothetical protein